MANLTTSTAVDELLQAANAAGIRAKVFASMSAAGAFNDADKILIGQAGAYVETTWGAIKAAILLAKYPEVNTVADLPAAADHEDETYMVLTTSGGVFGFFGDAAGFYRSDGATWTYVGEKPEDWFTDSILQIADDGDPTKILKFQLSALTTATTRTVSWQDKDGVVMLLADVHDASSKTTPVDTDEIGLIDSEASNVLKKLTWANLKATLKTYFDTLYNAALSTVSQAEAEAGTATTVRNWTAERVAQAIAALGGGGGGTASDVQTFDADGTWTKPAGTPKVVTVICFGAGGQGGGGCGDAAGTARVGGGGGGGGARTERVFRATDLPATVAVTVGVGGAAAGGGGSSAAGTAGTAGENSTFGAFVTAGGGGGGKGGTTATITVGGGGGGTAGQGTTGTGTGAVLGGAPTPSTTNIGLVASGGQGASGTSNLAGGCAEYGGGGGTGQTASPNIGSFAGGSSMYGSGGGASGGGVRTDNGFTVGGSGGASGSYNAGGGGAGATTQGAAGTAGADAGTTLISGSGGGGGAGNSAGTGGAGGAGGFPGGGGGGAGAGTTDGGAGGAGGNGRVVVITTY